MSRSRHHLIRPLPLLAILLASLTLATPAFAVTPTSTAAWSPKLAYVLTTGEVRAALTAKLHLTKAQDQRLRAIGWDLYIAQDKIRRESDLIVMDDGRTLAQKQAAIAAIGYNGSLESAEESAAIRAAAVVGMPPDRLAGTVSEVWQTDAATHNLETALTAMGLTPQSVVGSFRVYATRFYDEYATAYGVALPDKYAKFASNDTQYAPGYPDGTYAVSLYWDGVHRGRDNNVSTTVTTPHSVASAKVVDVGPWNTDDNYWDSYSDPVRPRRINNTGISGNGGLVGLSHLALGLPESQAAYFDYYGRPSAIPAHTTNPENYWDKPRGYNGEWSGADQFGRQVTQPAAVDLTPPVYADMGMTDNEWIDMVPLWEARLDLVGPIKATSGPYIAGQRVTFTFTVKNAGSMSGTWTTITFRTLQGGQYVYSPCVGPITLGPGESRTFSFTQVLGSAGNITGYPRMTRAGANSDIGATTVTLPNVAQRTVDRLGGATRFETAVELSKAAYRGTAPAVVIATGLNFPDALAGAALAHAEDGPMLLVGSTLPSSVEAEVRRLSPRKIFILGSTRVVSAGIEASLTADVPGATVTRLGGWNRYATARLIAQRVVTHSSGKAPNGTVIVATGRDFPDALAASVLSADKGWPIVLTEPDRVTTDTAAALTAVVATNSYVIGGNTVVHPSVLPQLPSPTRVAGADRYETSGLVADLAEKKGLSYAYVGLTLGSMYPDALAGGVLAAHCSGTMLLTPKTGLTSAVHDRLAAHRTVTTHLQAYGSTAALPDTTLTQAEDALR